MNFCVNMNKHRRSVWIRRKYTFQTLDSSVRLQLTIRNAWNIRWGGRTKCYIHFILCFRTFLFYPILLMIWANTWKTVGSKQIHSKIVLVQCLELWMVVTQNDRSIKCSVWQLQTEQFSHSMCYNVLSFFPKQIAKKSKAW